MVIVVIIISTFIDFKRNSAAQMFTFEHNKCTEAKVFLSCCLKFLVSVFHLQFGNLHPKAMFVVSVLT